MDQLSEINIEEKSTIYDVSAEYFSERKKEKYEAKITGVVESDGTITFRPEDKSWARDFIFDHSDPDRVIAISQMMLSFARMAKQDAAAESIDTSTND